MDIINMIKVLYLLDSLLFFSMDGKCIRKLIPCHLIIISILERCKIHVFCVAEIVGFIQLMGYCHK